MSSFDHALGAAAATAGARQTALLLHTMGEADRNWMLRQLPARERASAEQLLAELTALGVPADRKLLQDVIAPAGGATPPVGSVSPLAPRERTVQALNGCAAETIGPLLQRESDGVVARVLGCADWAWREGVLQHLGPTRRRRIEQLLPADPMQRTGCALDDALLDALASHCAATRAPGTPNRTHGATMSWRARLRNTLGR